MSWDNEKTNYKFYDHVHFGPENTDDFSVWNEACEATGADPPDDAESTFGYYGYEETVELEVDCDTGKVRCWGFSGTPLVDPVELN